MSINLLLVEDEPNVAEMLKLNLEAEGYGVVHAKNLASARQAIKENISLIVLDVMLPDGNGKDFAAELRAQSLRLPILMLTAMDTTDDIVTGLESGADDYLCKPFKLDELLGRVSALLRRQDWGNKQSELEAISFDGIEICVEKTQREGFSFELQKGCQIVEGSTALNWVVSRNTEVLVGEKVIDKNGNDISEWEKMEGVSDLSRNDRQQYIILQLLEEIKNFRSLGELTTLINTLEDAFVIDEKYSSGEIISIVRKIDKELIREVKIFDVYQGKNIASGNKSIAFNVTLEPKNKTLSEKDIEQVSKKIISTVQEITGATLRS